VFVKPDRVRTSLDVPRDAEQPVSGKSSRRPRRRLSLDPPLVASTGKPFDLTNAQIDELTELESSKYPTL